MAFAYCPDCGRRIYLGPKPWQGQPVSCDRCDADLEVTSLNPPKLDWIEALVSAGWDDSVSDDVLLDAPNAMP
jgi:lysine biosynthesis protein LysW